MNFLMMLYLVFGFLCMTFIRYKGEGRLIVRDLFVCAIIAFIWPMFFVMWLACLVNDCDFLDYEIRFPSRLARRIFNLTGWTWFYRA